MAGPAYLAQEREVSSFIVPISSAHDNLVTGAPSARATLSPYLRRIMLASASCSDAWAVIDTDAFTLLFLQNEINHKDDRAEAAY